MNLRRTFGKRAVFGAIAARLIEPLTRRLCGLEVVRYKCKDIDDMVFQSQLRQLIAGRRNSSREFYPFLDDRGLVLANEVRQTFMPLLVSHHTRITQNAAFLAKLASAYRKCGSSPIGRQASTMADGSRSVASRVVKL
jgi:hypothetical protein